MGAACGRHKVPLVAAALQFSLRDPRVSATIVGFSRPGRLEQTILLSTLPLRGYAPPCKASVDLCVLAALCCRASRPVRRNTTMTSYGLRPIAVLKTPGRM